MNNKNFEKKDLSNIELKPVLNFNFSTHILFKCLQKKYANDFLKGKFRFNQPKAWIEMEKNGNKGQGDLLEGVSLATNEDDNSTYIETMKCNKDYENFSKDGLTYFRNKGTIELFCYCLYGLNSNMFVNSEIDRFGKEHFIAKVEKGYFSAFAGNITEEDYFKLEEPDKPVVLFITNPNEFFNRIRIFFVNLGVPEKDIIISPIEYVDLKRKFATNIPKPYELLLKDSYFSNQSEVRIIINSTSEDLINFMNSNNNIIDIGPIEDIVSLYDNYFHDLLIEKQGNTILFTLPFPVEEELSNLTLRELLAYYIQIFNDRLPYETTTEERHEILEGIKETIQKKYNIYIDVDMNGKINYTNVSGDFEDLLDK